MSEKCQKQPFSRSLSSPLAPQETSLDAIVDYLISIRGAN